MLAEERDQEIERGKVTAISYEELMQRLRQCGLSITPPWRRSLLGLER